MNEKQDEIDFKSNYKDINKLEGFTFYLNLDLLQNIRTLLYSNTYKLDDLFENLSNSNYKSPEELKIILYIHKKILFLDGLFQNIAKGSNSNEVLLKEIKTILLRSYSSLTDEINENKLVNLDDIYEKFSKSILVNSNSKNTNSSNIKIILTSSENYTSEATSNEICIFLNTKLIVNGMLSNGRFNIYTRASILSQTLKCLNLNVLSDFLNDLKVMETELFKVISLGEMKKLNDKIFLEYVDLFINHKEKIPEALKELRKSLVLYQNLNDTASLKILETLYVKLLGHFEKEVRNEAVIALNILYDNTTWQEKTPFTSVIRSVEDSFKFDLIFRKKDISSYDNLICITNTPFSPYGDVISWNNIKEFKQIENSNLVKVTLDLGLFPQNGYFDWIIVKFKDGKFSPMKKVKDIKLEDDLSEAKGRFIVIDKTANDLSIHEVFCDLENAEIDKERGILTKRGTFKDLESKLDIYSQRYINCLYLMGALERDNVITYNEKTAEVIDISETNSSPMAITCRASISKLLGGDEAFGSLISKAKKFSMKIIIDMLARISSSRFHRKYRNFLVHTADDKGKINICFGTDGHSVHYEDSAILNYRKIESWDLLVEDVLSLANKHNIDGIHLDNSQSWPQIMEIDFDEMMRIDPDGEPAYTPLQVLDGEVVIRNEDCGYWGSDLIDQYPNPFFIKLTKSVWRQFPNFFFIGECWSTQKFNNRHVVLARSGIIPRMYTLPRTLSSVFGRRIHRNGYIELCKPSSVSIFKDWLIENDQFLPEGSVIVQSSCGQVWPYPALLHGRGNWTAIDLMFSLPNVPMTFMEEINGEAYRIQITNVYEQKTLPNNESNKITFKSKSSARLADFYADKDKNYNPKQTNNSSINSRSTGDVTKEIRQPTRVDSLISLSGVNLKDAKILQSKQDQLVKEVGPEFGFDLTKIKFHYDHRRKMRSTHESLRRGKLIFLNAYDQNNEIHPHVLAFARHTPEETGIIAINFSSQVQNFNLDLKPLLPLFDFEINFNSVCYIEDWITEERGDFYFIREVITEGQSRSLNVNKF